MTGPIVRSGRYYAAGTPDLLHVGANQQRAYAAENPGGSGDVIWQRIGSRVGSTGGNKRFRFAMMDTTTGSGSGGASSRVPSAVLRYTAEGTTSAGFSGSNGGETRFLDLTEPYLGPLNKGYAFAAASRDANLVVGMVQAASIPGSHNTWFYDRATDANGIPQAGYTSSSNQGHEAIWAEGELNVAPNMPGAVTISGGTGNRQPTLTADFSDANETLNNGVAWDYINASRYKITWGGTQRSDQTYTATTDERNNRRSSRQLAVQVPFDTDVTVEILHQDRAGLWSTARSITFQVQSGATVDRPTTPTGFITNLTNPGNIAAVYRHSGGLNANGMKAQLRTASGSLIKESPIKAVSVAPNGSLSMTWAESTFGTLPQASDLRITVQARDTNGNWSPVSDAVSIKTNAPPNVPVVASPANGAVMSARPKIVAQCSDPDTSQTATVYCRILNSSDVVLQTRTMTHIGGGTYEYQTVSGDLAAYGTFKFDTYSYDGSLYSGGVTSAASATRSAMRTFQYAAVPTVTITAPTSPVSTATPALTWTCPNQTHWRVRGYLSGVAVYDTGEVAGSTLNHQIQIASNWIGGERWNNGEAVSCIVSGRDSTGLWGDSAARVLTLTYPPVDQLVITGAAMALPGAQGTHYNHIHVAPSTYPGFLYYDWLRDDITGPGGAVIPGKQVHLRHDTNAANVDLDDFSVISNQWYRYAVVQTIASGNDVISSVASTIDLMVSFHGTLLHMPYDPPGTAVWLQYGTDRYEPEFEWAQGFASVLPMNGRVAFDYSSNLDSVSARFTTTLVPDDHMNALERLAALRRIWEHQNAHYAPDGRPHLVCWREGRGGEDSLRYGRLERVIRRHGVGETITADLEFGERYFVLGVTP